jgi:hypothetical protein
MNAGASGRRPAELEVEEAMSVEEVAGVSPPREAKDPTPVEDDWALRHHGSVSPDGLPRPSEPEDAAGGGPLALELVSRLCRTLDSEGVRYCHWKSNEALVRSATGENDLDLLVSRAHAQRFEAILRRLGFRDAELARWKRLPGVFHSYALDEPSGRLVHVHAQYQLVIGDDMTKGYRLPIEEAYLDSAAQGTLFRVPSPEFELAVFLLRMVIKHCAWDAIVCLQGSLSPSERRELDDLAGRVDLDQVWATMDRHLPFVPRTLWEDCLRAVRPGASLWFRIGTARRLQHALVPCSRRRRPVDTSLKVWRRSRILVRRKLFRRGPNPKRLAAGGALIAIVGGDGAGKSTAVEDLTGWLGVEFSTTSVHLGKPRRSFLSIVLKGSSTWKRYWPGLLGLAASLRRRSSHATTDRAHRHGGLSQSDLTSALSSSKDGLMGPRPVARLAWVVLTARDRHRMYQRGRRWASNGTIVVCDRYPLPQVKLMDGAVTAPVVDPSRL